MTRPMRATYRLRINAPNIARGETKCLDANTPVLVSLHGKKKINIPCNNNWGERLFNGGGRKDQNLLLN